MATGYALKELCDTSILDESIIDKENKRRIFSKIDSRGSASWYFFETISAACTGYLFVIDPYIPLILCMLFSSIGTVLSLGFEYYGSKIGKVNDEDKPKKSIKLSKKEKKLIWDEYKFIFNSDRLRSIFLFASVTNGLLFVRSIMTSDLLSFLNVKEQYFGIIFSIFTIFAVITTAKSILFHKAFKNKLLTFFGITYSLTIIIMGVVANLKINYVIILAIVLLMGIIQNGIKGPYYTYMRRYLNSFSDPHISIRIYAVNGMVESIGGCLMSFLMAFLLSVTTVSNALIIVGCGSLAVYLIIIKYMKTRLGLKPEEYKKEDIEFSKNI